MRQQKSRQPRCRTENRVELSSLRDLKHNVVSLADAAQVWRRP